MSAPEQILLPRGVPLSVAKSFSLSQVQLGPRGFSGEFTSESSGVALRSYFWPAHEPAKAIIVLLHGHGSYLCREYLRSTASPGGDGCVAKHSKVHGIV